MKSQGIYDSHVHVWPKESVPPYEAGPGDVDSLLQQMQANGAERAVLIQPSWLEEDHRYLIECIDAYPDAFIGVGLVNLQAPDLAKRVDGLTAGGYIRGIRVNGVQRAERGWLLGLERLWTRAADGDLPINVHLGPDWLEEVGEVARAYPALRLAVDHVGRPDVARGTDDPGFRTLLSLARLPNIYVKVSALPYFSLTGRPHADLMPFVEELWSVFGADRLMWGSDYPVVASKGTYEGSLDPIKKAGFLSEADRNQILRETVRRFYRWS